MWTIGELERPRNGPMDRSSKNRVQNAAVRSYQLRGLQRPKYHVQHYHVRHSTVHGMSLAGPDTESSWRHPQKPTHQRLAETLGVRWAFAEPMTTATASAPNFHNPMASGEKPSSLPESCSCPLFLGIGEAVISYIFWTSQQPG